MKINWTVEGSCAGLIRLIAGATIMAHPLNLPLAWSVVLNRGINFIVEVFGNFIATVSFIVSLDVSLPFIKMT